jgi:hypothetical protein
MLPLRLPYFAVRRILSYNCPPTMYGGRCPAMTGPRLEVRLDEERRRKLAEIVAARGVPVSQVVRECIDRAYDEALRDARLRAAEEIGRMEVEDVPDPETLSRQLDSTYAIPDLY